MTKQNAKSAIHHLNQTANKVEDMEARLTTVKVKIPRSDRPLRDAIDKLLGHIRNYLKELFACIKQIEDSVEGEEFPEDE